MTGLYALQQPDGTLLPIEEAAQIGRDPINPVHVPDPLVSRLHATVWPSGQALYVRDEGSSNGTFVNGKLGRPRRLRQGDRIQVGNTTLTVVAGPTKKLAR
jgi:pSer/pThr/pTyr-binding forkhead associated (FHA) protein